MNYLGHGNLILILHYHGENIINLITLPLIVILGNHKLIILYVNIVIITAIKMTYDSAKDILLA